MSTKYDVTYRSFFLPSEITSTMVSRGSLVVTEHDARNIRMKVTLTLFKSIQLVYCCGRLYFRNVFAPNDLAQIVIAIIAIQCNPRSLDVFIYYDWRLSAQQGGKW